MNLAPSTLKKIGAGLAVVLLALMLARFAVHSYGRAITNSNSGEGDQGAFLQLGLDLREHGTLTDGTRNPLYAAVLAVLAHREWDYFTQAKLASMAFGLLTIVAVFVLGWRYFNPFTGIVAAWLVSINVEFVVHSATALTESLLVLLFTLAWFAMLRALDRPDRWGIWALAGVLTALAYLAKGSGQLLGYAFLLTGLLLY
ncbi:MAG: phospholipid carrier-dependent glycosyltransferase, partial [Chloroflexi bacterium]